MAERSGETSHGVVVPNQWYDDWITENISDLSGKVAIVTGGNSGTGFWAASALAGKGCTVVLACRSEEKATAAKTEILGYYPDAKVDVSMVMDNMDLETVRTFAQAFNTKYDRLDFLLNNAGIMAQPLIKSKDGFDIQFQTNHLAHFLLTQLLWDKMVQTEGQSRIVNHSSVSHKLGSPVFDKNKMDDPSYSWGLLGMNAVVWKAMPLVGFTPVDNWLRYGVSKLCNVLFTKMLADKIEEKGLGDKIIAVACHPGYANTNLQHVAKDSMKYWERLNSGTAQSAADGSLPLLLSTVGKDIKDGDYCEPSLNFNVKGPPMVGKVGGNGNNPEMAQELWSFSEECVKTTFTI
jgi:NAD(P)-dependent dehydrogenase (short-subunit alcohol dehydrogenase family)